VKQYQTNIKNSMKDMAHNSRKQLVIETLYSSIRLKVMELN